MILITAPIGAIAIAVSGPKFLKKEHKSLVMQEDIEVENGRNVKKSFPFYCFSS